MEKKLRLFDKTRDIKDFEPFGLPAKLLINIKGANEKNWKNIPVK
jgi:hypothetical protein